MRLLEFLQSRKDEARRIFGERELKIIEKQLKGLILTQSEKNRLSIDIRKKFAFINVVGTYKNEFGLKHGFNVKQFIENVIEDIKRDILFYKVKRIVLFGSTVTRKRHFNSDIDVAVEFNNITNKQALEFRVRILKNFEKLDLQVYNTLPDKVKKEINKEGKILYEKNKR